MMLSGSGSAARERWTGIVTGFLATLLAASAAGAATIPLGNVYTVLAATTNDKRGDAGRFADAPGGHAGLVTLELDDDYDAIQLGVINQTTSAWGVQQVVVSPSASYGGERVIGAAGFDLDGGQLSEMLPVQWSNQGANSDPGTAQQVLSLPTSAAASAGQTSLSFASTTTLPAYGSVQPQVGWHAGDALDCLASGTKIVAISATSVTLSSPVTGIGCGAGQAIYFSPATIGPFGQPVAAAASAGNAALTFSDWLQVHSLPRTDGGFVTGGVVSGTGIAGGTTLTAIGYTSLSLSKPLAGAVPAQSAVVIGYSATLAGDAAGGATSLVVGTTNGLRAGQSVTGDNGLAAHTHVVAVSGSRVTLDQALKQGISGGTTLNFSNTTWTSLAADAGSRTLAVPSTNYRPLLHLRFFVQPGRPITTHDPHCWRNASRDSLPCEAPLGLPAVWTSVGGQSGNQMPVDGLNYVSRIGPGAGTPQGYRDYPSFFIRLLGRHAGTTVLICGGYQSSGAAGSVSGEAAAARIGAAWASAANPAVPVTSVNIASYSLDTGTNFANCKALDDALLPGLVLIQDYSNHNGSNDIVAYRAQVQAVAQHVLGNGGQPAIYLGYVEASAQVGGLVVASAVKNDVRVPLMSGIATPASGSPSLITGPGIPPGTTARLAPGTWHITLSQPATIAAGAVLHLAYQVASADGTSVTLTHPSFASLPSDSVTGSGIAAATTIVATRKEVRATLSSQASLQPGTMLQISHAPPQSDANYAAAGQWFYGQTAPWDSVQLDALGTLGTDPAHPTFLCDGCSTTGEYANDYGNSLVASAFVRLLQQLTGQN